MSKRQPKADRSVSVPNLTIEQIAAQQGVSPVRDFAALLRPPSPTDESVDEFQTMLRQWRREGTPLHRPQ